jgi:hypothetical protein
MASSPNPPLPAPLGEPLADEPNDELGADTQQERAETTTLRRVGPWAAEHEPDSDSYLLIGAAGEYCADLHWNDRGECWAQFEPYIAFSGATTIADIEALLELADLLRSLPPPDGRRPKNPRGQ